MMTDAAVSLSELLGNAVEWAGRRLSCHVQQQIIRHITSPSSCRLLASVILLHHLQPPRKKAMVYVESFCIMCGCGAPSASMGSPVGKLCWLLTWCLIMQMGPLANGVQASAGIDAAGLDGSGDQAGLLQKALGGHPGGTAFTPTMYRPVVQVQALCSQC